MPAPVDPSCMPPPSGGGADRAQAVQRMFDQIAGRYDCLNDWISLGMHRGWKRAAIRQLQLKPGMRVLDVCTGTGDLARMLTRTVGATGSVVGLDFSGEMLALARERDPVQAVQWVQGDALALPFEADTFDGAIVAFGLRNVTDLPRTLAELARVVRPGGRVVSLDTCPDPALPGFNWYFRTVVPKLAAFLGADEQAYRYLSASTAQFVRPETLAELMQAAGLTQVTLRRLGGGSLAWVAGVAS